MKSGASSEGDRWQGAHSTRVAARAASSLVALVMAMGAQSASAQTGGTADIGPAVMQASGAALPAPETPPRAEPQATLLQLPVIVDGGRAPDATVALTGDRATGVVAAEIAASLSGLVSADIIERIAARGGQVISIEELAATGLGVRFDAATLSLVIDVPVALRRAQSFSGLGDNQFAGLRRVVPENFAAGLTASLFLSDDLGGLRATNSRLAMSGFVNVGGVRGFNLIYGGELALSGSQGSRAFQRDRLILFRDDPERAIRYSAGDLAPRQNRFLGQFDLLGFSVERSYADIQPLRNIRPTGRSAFTLERESLVEVYANGALIRSFRATY
jgi:outer membrane usher protein